VTGAIGKLRLAWPTLPVVLLTGIALGGPVASARAQRPPRGGRGNVELRTPSDFSPIDLNGHGESTATAPPRDSSRGNLRPAAGGKTPIRRDSDLLSEDAPHTRTPVGSPWGTLATVGGLLLGSFVITRMLRRSGSRSGPTPALDQFEVLAGRRLDGQSSIHLVRIGRRIVAVASSSAGVQPLTVIDDPLEVEELVSGGAPARPRGPVASATPLFSGARAIRRTNEPVTVRPPGAGSSQVFRREAAAAGLPVEGPDG